MKQFPVRYLYRLLEGLFPTTINVSTNHPLLHRSLGSDQKAFSTNLLDRSGYQKNNLYLKNLYSTNTFERSSLLDLELFVLLIDKAVSK
uniref:NADH-plastoquinone oxidoreductase subunit J n=2 Tax=Keteleeria TaxID=3323 RepID=A0A8F4XMK2_KETDA|nr:NADH-plastoquinone oxidoreductase subunit J [Keteleeria evelyniana]QOW07149.1 NADH-plastoquinone oxidoreductase subunit J [Keteleeria evelyniana]QXI88833.1 NADH-plastoquinone oxidoreductase subunit J [Keteleeria davidiana]UWI54161.1 NADH-plastoquinone oxidoreductase subunit J [Keteleeria evelyniana var. pendula]